MLVASAPTCEATLLQSGVLRPLTLLVTAQSVTRDAPDQVSDGSSTTGNDLPLSQSASTDSTMSKPSPRLVTLSRAEGTGSPSSSYSVTGSSPCSYATGAGMVRYR